MKKLLTLCALAAFSNTLYASDRAELPYLSIDAVQLIYDQDNASVDAKPTAGRIRFGSELTKHFGLEVQYLNGLDDTDKVTVGGEQYEGELNYIYSIFGKAYIELGPVELYTLLGASYASLDSDPPPLTNSDVFNSYTIKPSYFVGVAYNITDHWFIVSDYGVYLPTDAYSLSAGGIGVGYNF